MKLLGKPAAVTVKLPALPTVNVVLAPLVKAGAWSDGQGEALRGGGSRRRCHPMISGVDAARTGRRGARQHAADVLNAHAAGQRPVAEGEAGREARGRHREAAGAADRERRIAGAGDGRSLIDREREALAGRSADAICGGEGHSVRAAGTGRRCPTQHAG